MSISISLPGPRLMALCGVILLVAGCTGAPSPVTPVSVAENATAVSATPTAEPAGTLDSAPTAVETASLPPAASPTRKSAADYADLEIVTLLPRDAIPAIDNPRFLSADEADEFYDPDELVIGVNFDGDARAYSVPLLSNHEIVNDTVGGVKIAVTW